MRSQSGCGCGWNHPEASSLPCLVPGPGGRTQPGGVGGSWDLCVASLRGLSSRWARPAGLPTLWLRAPVHMSQEGGRCGRAVCIAFYGQALEITQHHFRHILSLRNKLLRLPTLEPTLMGRALQNLGHVLSHHGEHRWLVQGVDFGRRQSKGVTQAMGS